MYWHVHGCDARVNFCFSKAVICTGEGHELVHVSLLGQLQKEISMSITTRMEKASRE